MVWWLQSHGLMVAMAGGGGGGHSHVTEAAVVVPCRVVVAVWCGGHSCGCMA
jgi:hypothetical protein